MILLVPCEREGTGRVSRWLRGGQARNKKRDSARELFKRCTVAPMELLRFPLHYNGIEHCEVDNQDEGRDPRARGDSGPQSQDGTAEIEWISGVSIGTGDAENFLLVKIASCVRAHYQTDDPHQAA